MQISLSDKAAARLATLSEGIVISAAYTGNPRPTAKRFADESGNLSLGVETVQISLSAATAHFTGTIGRSRLRLVEGPIRLNLNAYSARRSGPDNILACDFFDGKLKDAVGAAAKLHCSLIDERLPTVHKP